MNEQIQIITGYHPLIVTGTVLSCLWLGAYILSWIIQWSWAWVDETKASSNNWVVNKFKQKTTLIEPMNGWYRTLDYWHYRKFEGGKEVARSDSRFKPLRDIKEDGGEIQKTPLGYVKLNGQGGPYTSNDVDNYFLILPLIWTTMFSLWIWYISMWVVMAFALAHTMRMARRGQKLLTKHIEDKSAHK